MADLTCWRTWLHQRQCSALQLLGRQCSALQHWAKCSAQQPMGRQCSALQPMGKVLSTTAYRQCSALQSMGRQCSALQPVVTFLETRYITVALQIMFLQNSWTVFIPATVPCLPGTVLLVIHGLSRQSQHYVSDAQKDTLTISNDYNNTRTQPQGFIQITHQPSHRGTFK